MADGTLVLKNTTTEEVKNAPTGYSWTVAFFGFFPAVARQDWRGAGIVAGFIVLVWVLMGYLGFLAPFLIAGIYNDKVYSKHLLSSGNWKIVEYRGSKPTAKISSRVGFPIEKFFIEKDA